LGRNLIILIQIYHSRLISEGVAEASEIFYPPTFYQNYLAIHCRRDRCGKPRRLIAVYLRGKWYKHNNSNNSLITVSKLKLLRTVNSTSSYTKNVKFLQLIFNRKHVAIMHRFDWDYLTFSTNLSCCCRYL
jgi:hypothetical protein